MNHPTTVPEGHTAGSMDGVTNPARQWDDETVIRRFATTYSEVHVIGRDGARQQTYLFALAQELDRRGLSAQRALDRHGVAREAATVED
jgi:hypothetical protein